MSLFPAGEMLRGWGDDEWEALSRSRHSRKCVSCKADVVAGAKFCAACGKPVHRLVRHEILEVNHFVGDKSIDWYGS